MTVQREEKAYPFSALVADCGGVLGLFIGFNFLIVWGWFVLLVNRINNCRYTRLKPVLHIK